MITQLDKFRPLLVVVPLMLVLNAELVSAAKTIKVDVYELPGVALQPPIGDSSKGIENSDPNIDLAVEIFELVDGLAVGQSVGPTYSTSAKGQLKIHSSSGANAQYHSNWDTNDSGQADRAHLRVEVRSANASSNTSACNTGVGVASGCIAYFNVMLHESKRTANWAFTPQGVMPLVNGQILPIKVRIAPNSLDDTQASQLIGDDSDPATAAIPNLKSTLRSEDFSDSHPELGGLMISINTLSLVFTLDTTVGEANVILASLGARIVGGIPGIAGEIEGALLLRLPITTHEEMIATLATLRSNPNVKLVVQESLLETTSIPKPNTGAFPDPVGWTWETVPGTDNWGMESIRAPQMWGLNDAVKKQGTSTVTGVHDAGFFAHPDLIYQSVNGTVQHDHGTHVAGTIGATFDNGIGVDGVNPFAALAVNGLQLIPASGWGLLDFISARGDLRLINVSLGNNWYNRTPPIDPNISMPAQNLVMQQGGIFNVLQKALQAAGQSLPLILAAAGNDSRLSLNPFIAAQWSSAMNYAALVLAAENILVVEAVQLSGAAPGGASRSSFSNLNGHLSAPGSGIMSTTVKAVPPLIYENKNGTSMATPHVTGLASYLLSLDPSLTNAELRQLLLENAVAVGGGASPRIDAFASSLAIDGIRGNDPILMKLVDIDDGSMDGNRRTICDADGSNCTDVSDTDFDSDGGRGDGSVDMADFRAWRDRFLQVDDDPALSLDGSANHPKKDLNGDGLVQAAIQENVYPLGDFNGDGIIDLTGTNAVPGSISTDVTDLEVLEYLFSDPHYEIGDLQALVRSWDIEVETGQCFFQTGAVEVRSMLMVSGSTSPVDERVHTSEEAVHIYTAASGQTYTVKIQAFDSSGKVIATSQKEFTAVLGGDDLYPSECNSITAEPETLEITLNLDQTVDRTITLSSERLTASFEIINDIPNIVVNDDRGTVDADSTFELSLTVACPATGEGVYGYSLDYGWTDVSGNTISENVPETLKIILTCVEEMEEVCPDPTFPPELKITNLGSYSGLSNFAIDINDCGQILGGRSNTSIPAGSVDDPYLWLPAAAYGIGPGEPQRLADHGVAMTSASGMNKHGQIIGVKLRDVPTPEDLHEDVLWSWDDGFTSLVPPGIRRTVGFSGGANDINDLGQVVGTVLNCEYSEEEQREICVRSAFLWLPEVAYGLQAGFNDLGILGINNGLQLSIDNNGVIFGALQGTVTPFFEFFEWNQGVYNLLGNLGGANNAKRNSLGQIAAQYPKEGNSLPHFCPCDSFFLDVDGSIANLGSLGSSTQVADINDQGVIVGHSTTPDNKTRAYVWKDGVMLNLGSLFNSTTTISRPEAINEHGQIAGGSSVSTISSTPVQGVKWEVAP